MARLELTDWPLPQPEQHEVLLRVLACGICRTDLHLLDAELPDIPYPVIPGHEIVGEVVARGPLATEFEIGERAGVPWLAHTCGACDYCRRGAENLCSHARFTGYTRNGGYAQFVTADSRYCLRIPATYSDDEAAPLLCAGLIGYRAYRAYRAAGDGQALGLYGFGAAAHVLAQVAMSEGRRVHVFTRPEDVRSQQFAMELGASWAGGSGDVPPEPLDAAILFAPAGELVPVALSAVRPGGRVVCAGIHMTDIPSFPYRLLWGERTLCSVANLTRADGVAFMTLAGRVRLAPRVETVSFQDLNDALDRLRRGEVEGALVLVP